MSKELFKKLISILVGNITLILLYLFSVYKSWYDPTNFFAGVMFMGSFFGLPIIIFIFNFIVTNIMFSLLKVEFRKNRLAITGAITIGMFVLFHIGMSMHAQIGNTYIEKNIEKYAFEGNVENYSKEKLAALGEELGYKLDYQSSIYETDFYSYFSGSGGGNYDVEGNLELIIKFTISEDSCDKNNCGEDFEYKIVYQSDTFEIQDVDIPLRDEYMLRGIAGEYQEEIGSNYYYMVRVTKEGKRYKIDLGELSSSGYWDKESTNYGVILKEPPTTKKLHGVVYSPYSDHIKHFEGKNAVIYLIGNELRVEIEGEKVYRYYK